MSWIHGGEIQDEIISKEREIGSLKGLSVSLCYKPISLMIYTILINFVAGFMLCCGSGKSNDF